MENQAENLELKKHIQVAYSMYHTQDKNSYEIKQFFMDKGYSEEYSDQVVQSMLNIETAETKRDKNGLWIGLGLIGLGVGLSIAFPGRLFYGAAIVGLIYIGRWMFQD